MKKIITKARWVLLAAALYFFNTIPAQAAEHYYSYNKSHQGYSMVESHDPDNIVVAGSICNTPGDCKIFVQETNKYNGTVVWRKEYNWKPGSERCFKILKVGPGYLLTGYAYDAGIHKAFVLEIDGAGNINWVYTYQDPQFSSVGLHALECSDGTGYVVAGYTTELPGTNSPTRSGFIMKLSPSGAQIWNTLYDSPKSGQDYDMAEQLIEVPGSSVNGATTSLCYYVTGTVNLIDGTKNIQKVLSVMLDDNGNWVWQRSWSTGTPPSNYDQYQEVGVSSFYESNMDRILHVSNAENTHGFFVSVIDPSNGTVLAHKYIADGTLSTSCKLAAYQIHDKNTNTFAVTGFIHNYDWSSVTHNPTFAIDIDKGSLLPSSPIHVFEIPSNGHNTFFAGWLGTPATSGYPTIHTPDMAVWSGSYIWMVCYKQNGAVYDLAIQRMLYATYAEACDPEDYQPQYNDVGTLDIQVSFVDRLFQNSETFTDNEPSFTVDSCMPPPPHNKPTNIAAIGNAGKGLHVYPSPAGSSLNVELDRGAIQHISISDMAGRVIRSYEYNTQTIDVSALTPGMYLVRVITEDKQEHVRRFIKE